MIVFAIRKRLFISQSSPHWNYFVALIELLEIVAGQHSDSGFNISNGCINNISMVTEICLHLLGIVWIGALGDDPRLPETVQSSRSNCLTVTIYTLGANSLASLYPSPGLELALTNRKVNFSSQRRYKA